jgi:glutamyl-tRNA reductase
MMLFSEPQYSEWELIKTLQYQAKDGDVILCTGLTRPIVEYAMADENVTILSYPQDMKHHLAHLNEAWYIQNVNLNQEAHTTLQRAVDELNTNKIIVIWSGREINRPLQELIDSDTYQYLTRNIYSHPKMGLSRLNEPLSLWILQ